MLLFFFFYLDLQRLTSSMQHCLSLCPWLSCYSMCLVTCLYKIWLLPHLTPLSALPSFCPSEIAIVNITTPLSCFPSSVCYHLYIFLSICVSSPLFFFLPHSFSPSPSLMSAFIRCVNNCLPTVVIAPPCQLEVWSKWQCAQFSLACIVQFLVSLVPIAKKKSPHYSCVLSVLLISEPVNMFTFHLDFLVCPWNILLFMCCGRIYCLG